MMRDERGFTIVELLVTMSIMGIAAVAMTGGLIVGLRTSDQTRARVASSHDAQVVASWLVPDIQSATNVSTSDPACAGTTPVVRLRWSAAGVQTDAAYVVRTVGEERRLTRRLCRDGSLVTETDVAHLLDPAVAPVVACSPGSCSGTPARVRLTLTEADGFTYTVAGTRRAS